MPFSIFILNMNFFFFNKLPITFQLSMMVKNQIFTRKKTGHLFDRNEYFKYVSKSLTELLHSKQQQ